MPPLQNFHSNNLNIIIRKFIWIRRHHVGYSARAKAGGCSLTLAAAVTKTNLYRAIVAADTATVTAEENFVRSVAGIIT